MKKQPAPQADVRRWNTWLRKHKGRSSSPPGWPPTLTHLYKLIGKHETYLSNMEAKGCIPPPPTVVAIAEALGANPTEALLHAGYVPEMHAPCAGTAGGAAVGLAGTGWHPVGGRGRHAGGVGAGVRGGAGAAAAGVMILLAICNIVLAATLILESLGRWLIQQRVEKLERKWDEFEAECDAAAAELRGHP